MFLAHIAGVKVLAKISVLDVKLCRHVRNTLRAPEAWPHQFYERMGCDAFSRSLDAQRRFRIPHHSAALQFPPGFFPTAPTEKKTLLFLPPKGFEDSFYDDIPIDITLGGQDGYQPTEEDIAPALNRITIEDTPCDPMLKGEKD